MKCVVAGSAAMVASLLCAAPGAVANDNVNPADEKALQSTQTDLRGRLQPGGPQGDGRGLGPGRGFSLRRRPAGEGPGGTRKVLV
jgi:hypothetical protein